MQNSFSHRQAQRTFKVQAIENHKFHYSKNDLAFMINNFAIYCEMGGLFGVCTSLRTDTVAGLRVDEKKGESKADIVECDYAKRIEHYGRNVVEMPPMRSIWEHAWEALEDPMLRMLIVAAVFSIIFQTIQHPSNGFIDGLAILFAVFLVVSIGSFNNWSQDKEFRKNAEEQKGARLQIIRGGVESTYDQDDILVGDLVKLSPGNMVPADGVLVTNANVRVNESSVTGESEEIMKSYANPFFLSGAAVVSGSGYYIVTAVGPLSTKGKLMANMVQEREKTALQERLDVVAEQVGTLGMVSALLVFIALLIRWGLEKTNHVDHLMDIVNFFILGVTIIVVAVPEGLPLAVTVSLAYSLAQMKEDKNNVKVLSACETMGNCTAICSDKTGTLTQNRMTVVASFVGGVVYETIPKKDQLSEALHDLLVESIVINSDRRVARENMDYQVLPEDWKWEGDGGETESALLSWLARYHDPTEDEKISDIMQLRVDKRSKTVHFYPFSSSDKYSSVIMLHPDEAAGKSGTTTQSKLKAGIKCRQYFKGAADRLLSKCTSAVDTQGNVVPLGSLKLPECIQPGCGHNAMYGEVRGKPLKCRSHGEKDYQNHEACVHSYGGVRCNRWAIMAADGDDKPMYCHDASHHPDDVSVHLVDSHPMKIMENYARSGLRTICSAYCDSSSVEFTDGKIVTKPGENWTFISLVGIKDPLRLQTKAAVRSCQKAGIVVRMVTGDNIETAQYIARDCGIMTAPHHLALEGRDFREALFNNDNYFKKNNKNSETFVALVRNLRVMARCQPEDKLELVKFLKGQDEIVSVTGDGSNDGPALTAAHVGLAMGIAGTDVSKAAAKIIIEDDNFNSIVRAVVWGRSVYDNIRKFLQFQLCVNVTALLIATVGAISGKEEPLKPVQLLWVNLVMDTMGALALGTEYPKDTLLDRKAYHIEAPLISKIMWRNILGQAAAQVVILFVILYGGEDVGIWDFKLNGVYDQVYHYTFLFNVFVWLQFWNEIASRKVNTELNIFESFFDNPMFTYILIVTAIMQMLMVEVFGSFASTHPQSWTLWLWAVSLGAVMIPTSFLLRMCPIDPEEGQIEVADDTFEGAAWLKERQKNAHSDAEGGVELAAAKKQEAPKLAHTDCYKPNAGKEPFLIVKLESTPKLSE